MNEPINKIFLFFVLLFISLVLIFTFLIEYKLGHQPCKLCIYERIPYFISIFLIGKFFFIKAYDKITLLLLSLTFIFSFTLAFYHFGIEQGFFEESLVCETVNSSQNLTKEELLEQLNKNTVGCKDVNFRILGFSLAAINTIFSLILSAIFIRLLTIYEKN